MAMKDREGERREGRIAMKDYQHSIPARVAIKRVRTFSYNHVHCTCVTTHRPEC